MKIFIQIVLILTFTSYIHAEDVNKFEETIILKNRLLKLNGSGTRKVTIFGVKAYDIALYLEFQTQDTKLIIDKMKTKKVITIFRRDVRREKILNAWEEGISANYKDLSKFKSQLDRFLEKIKDAKKADICEFDFEGSLLSVIYNGKKLDTFDSIEFQKAILSVWIGKKPASESLKQDLLGENK